MEDVLIITGMGIGSAGIESTAVQAGYTAHFVPIHPIVIIVHIIMDNGHDK